MTIDILITLNNFIHDLAAAMWLCGTLIIYVIVKRGLEIDQAEATNFVRRVYKTFSRVTNLSLAVVLLGGVVRAFAYRKYEWAPALGRDQVTLLVIKHILLAVIVLAGIWIQTTANRKVKRIRE